MTDGRFRLKSVEKHMCKHFPNCPLLHRDEIIRMVTDRTWKDASIGRAVGITVTNYVRHRLTDYEMLMKRHELTREEARIAEAGTVKAILDSWRISSGPAQAGED